MSRKFAFPIVVTIAALGLVFLSLDILDIAEDFRIRFPVNILNAIFVTAIAIVVAYLAARHSAFSRSISILCLGCGALAFGAGSLIKGMLFMSSLNVPLTIFEIIVLLASVLHLTGAILNLKQTAALKIASSRKFGVIIGFYLGTLAIIALISVLADKNIFPPFYTTGTSTTLIRDVVRGTTIILFFFASAAYLRRYFKHRASYLYWYSLGLLLFCLGLFFLSQGAIQSRLYWLGNISLYIGGAYLLVGLAYNRRDSKAGIDS
jgi:hypothetical protein